MMGALFVVLIWDEGTTNGAYKHEKNLNLNLTTLQ